MPILTEESLRAELNDRLIPVHLHDGFVNYILYRKQPGHFLTAVLMNNLMEAINRADHVSISCLREICVFLYNIAPSACWGSPSKVAEWLTEKQSDESRG